MMHIREREISQDAGTTMVRPHHYLERIDWTFQMQSVNASVSRRVKVFAKNALI